MAGLLGIVISTSSAEVPGCGFGTFPDVLVKQHDFPEQIARSFCYAALGHGLQHMTADGIARHHNMTGIYLTPSLTVAKQHIFSVTLDGPYWWDMVFPPVPSISAIVQVSPLQHRIVKAFAGFSKIHNYRRYFHGGLNFKGTPLEHRTLPKDFTSH
ncbi:g5401 [Coccomyxa elongata]